MTTVISRRGEHDRPSLLRYAAKLPLKTVRWTVFNKGCFVWISKHSAVNIQLWFALSKTSHCDVLEIYFVSYRKKGERSCPLPLGMTVVIPHPFHRFERYALCSSRLSAEARGGDFALCGARPKGSALWTSASWAQLDQL